MSETVLLVDFENVHNICFGGYPRNTKVYIFYCERQQSVSVDLVPLESEHKLTLEWVKVAVGGKNNLDFHIAYYLGLLTKAQPEAEYFILSHDRGFEALVGFILSKGIKCHLITKIEELAQVRTDLAALGPGKRSTFKPAAREEPNLDRLIVALAGVPMRHRPSKRSKLENMAISHFSKWPREQIKKLVNELFTSARVQEVKGRLVYHLLSAQK